MDSNSAIISTELQPGSLKPVTRLYKFKNSKQQRNNIILFCDFLFLLQIQGCQHVYKKLAYTTCYFTSCMGIFVDLLAGLALMLYVKLIKAKYAKNEQNQGEENE